MSRTIDLESLTLADGDHSSFEQGACLLEAVSYLAGEPWSDHPKCVSPVLGAYGRRLNDQLGDADRQLLKPYIPRLIGTAGDGQDDARRWMAADWAIRVATPRWLDAAGLAERAAELRSLAPVVDAETAAAARPVARAARDEAWAARQASRERLTEHVREELAKRGLPDVAVDAAADAAAAAAAAVDVAVDVAVDAAAAAAAAAAVAAAADAAAAAAVAAAAAAAADAAADFSWGTAGYWKIRDAVFAKLKALYAEELREGAFAEARDSTNREAVELLGRMIDPSAVTE